jgi:hypothetical protein
MLRTEGGEALAKPRIGASRDGIGVVSLVSARAVALSVPDDRQLVDPAVAEDLGELGRLKGGVAVGRLIGRVRASVPVQPRALFPE